MNCLEFGHINCLNLEKLKKMRKFKKIDEVCNDDYWERVLEGRSLFKRTKICNK